MINAEITGKFDGSKPMKIGSSKDGRLLVQTKSALEQGGTFRSSSRTSAGTTVIASAKAGGSLTLTDLIISTDKTNGSDVTIRFNDGSQAVDIAVFDSVNAPVSMGIAFTGSWQGWADADLEMVTTGAVTATAAVGYIRIESDDTDSFSVWDAKR